MTGGWWVRSFADGDTHYGTRSDVSRSVHGACGAEFAPLPVGIPARLAPLPVPPTHEQVCQTCFAIHRSTGRA